MLWMAEAAITLDNATVHWTPVYGEPGLVVAGLGLVAIMSRPSSWSHAFLWSALASCAGRFSRARVLSAEPLSGLDASVVVGSRYRSGLSPVEGEPWQGESERMSGRTPTL